MLNKLINFDTLEVNWNEVEQLPEFQKLTLGGYHAEWHQEGDSLKHTKLVIDACQTYIKENSDLFDKYEKKVLITASLFHDIGKGFCNKLKEDGNWSAPYHNVEGERLTRFMLWDEDGEFRDEVCSLVKYHMKPKHLAYKTKEERERIVIEITVNSNAKLLYYINLFDTMGAISLYRDEEIRKCEIYGDVVKSLDCWENNAGYKFPSLYQKFEFFHNYSTLKHIELTTPNEKSEKDNDFAFNIVMLCGVAGGGKTTVYKNLYEKLGYEIVSRDIIRQELGMVGADGKFKGNKEQEEKVTQIEHKRIKELCEQRKNFVSDNLFIRLKYRQEFIKMVMPYNPRIAIHYTETSKQNHLCRRDGQIDRNVILKMMMEMEYPYSSEAHLINYDRT
jgi:predicted kinase